MGQEMAIRKSEKASNKQISRTATCAQRELLHDLPPKCVLKPTSGLMQRQRCGAQASTPDPRGRLRVLDVCFSAAKDK